MGWLKDGLAAVTNYFQGNTTNENKNSDPAVTKAFNELLPDKGGKANTNDNALVIKTSPIMWEYEMFNLDWNRRATLREIELMLKSDTRVKRANHVLANTAVRKGITVTVSSTISKSLAEKAQEIINDLMRDCQINSKLTSWSRILPKAGDLFLNPVVDLEKRKIKNIKSLPAITMQRNDDMTGNFPDPEKAFTQIDPVSLQPIMDFPLWAVNHIRYDHEDGERYGQSQYLTCRGFWNKLNRTEEDLVVRRRTRAVPRRLHSQGTKDNPGDWSEIEQYKSLNNLNPRTSQVTTDYYGNGLTDIKDLNADAQLDHIKDVEHIQEVYMIGTNVPLHILGFGQNVNRDVVEDQKTQFEDDTQELRTLLEHGDSSPYSGLRFIFNFALALAGIDATLVDLNFRWYANDNEKANARVDRVIKLRKDPLISRRLALTIVSKDLGLENQAAIEAELKAVEEEQRMQPSGGKPNTATEKEGSGEDDDEEEITDSKKKVFFPLHGKRIARLEGQFSGEIRRNYKSVYKEIKPELDEYILKIPDLRTAYTDDPVPRLVEQALEMLENALNENQPEMSETFIKYHLAAANYAKSNAGKATGKPLREVEPFVNSDVQSYFKSQAVERMKKIDETTKGYLRNELLEAYNKQEGLGGWDERIEKVLGCDLPDGRAEMIARTELAWAYSKGIIETFKENGTHKVRWLTVMDNRTCDVCRSYSQEVFNLSELPSLPVHPRCRCTIVATDD